MNSFHAIDPATGESLEPAFTESTPSDIDRAMRDAEQAFLAYRECSGRERATFLRAIAHEIEGIAEELSSRAHAETALPMVRLEGERIRTINQLLLIAGAVEEGSWSEARIDRANPSRTPTPRSDIRRMLVPLGPVAVFGASNFPLAFGAAGNDTAAALGAGCPVVYKAHAAQPGTSQLIASAIERAARGTNMPDGVFAIVHGWHNDVGLALVKHPLTRAVGFTGSLHGGRALFDAAAARHEPIPVFAELGSVNPVFVFPSAVRERAVLVATALAQSIAMGVGQLCTSPGVIIARNTDYFPALRDALVQQMSAMAPGVPLYQRLADSFHLGVARAMHVGASAHGADDGTMRVDLARMSPTLLTVDADTFLAHHELRDEIFGPVSVLVGTHEPADFERIVDAMDGQLTATVFATPDELVQHASFLRKLERKVGRIVFNGVPTGVEVSPAMHHGGPYPASTDVRTTSIGTASIARFARPVCYQGFPDAALPDALRDANPLGMWRMIDGAMTRDAVVRP